MHVTSFKLHLWRNCNYVTLKRETLASRYLPLTLYLLQAGEKTLMHMYCPSVTVLPRTLLALPPLAASLALGQCHSPAPLTLILTQTLALY